MLQNTPATYAVKTNRRFVNPQNSMRARRKVKPLIPLGKQNKKRTTKKPLYSLSLHACVHRNNTIIKSLGGRSHGNMSEGCRVAQKLERRQVCSSITDYEVSLGKSLSISAWHLQNGMIWRCSGHSNSHGGKNKR